MTCSKSIWNLLCFSAKINVFLKTPPGKLNGPQQSSPYDYVKLSFRSGNQDEVSIFMLI